MRVLWVDLISELGGAQYSLLEVCGGLTACGVEVVAAVPPGPLFERLSALGIQVFPVSPLRASRRGWGLFKTTAKLLRAPGTVCQIIRAVKPDLIHTNSLPAFFAARKTFSHIPVVWHVRDLRLPVLIARDASKKAARIIAASEAIDEYLVSILSPRVLGRISVIRNGIDLARFAAVDRSSARRRLGISAESTVIGMVAHLIPWKRHDAFIEAAAMIHRERPDVQFALVGRNLFNEHSRWISQLEKKVEQLGLTDVFHWVMDCDDAAQVLPAFDLLMHPALNEPFGRVICEAMALSIPVIAAGSGGPAAIIDPGVSGLLVRDGDPQRMAEEALALLADPARAAALATAGRACVEGQFTTHRVCEQLVQEYRTLIEAASASGAKDDA